MERNQNGTPQPKRRSPDEMFGDIDFTSITVPAHRHSDVDDKTGVIAPAEKTQTDLPTVSADPAAPEKKDAAPQAGEKPAAPRRAVRSPVIRTAGQTAEKTDPEPAAAVEEPEATREIPVISQEPAAEETDYDDAALEAIFAAPSKVVPQPQPAAPTEGPAPAPEVSAASPSELSAGETVSFTPAPAAQVKAEPPLTAEHTRVLDRVESVMGVGRDDDEKNKKKHRDRTTLPSLVKALIYIVSVLVISVFLSYFIISVGNDVFAFSKPKMVTTVEITDHMTLHETAQLLSDNGMIKHPLIFELYVKIKDIRMEFVPGTYEIHSQMNYEDFIDTFNQFKHGATREQVVITIPEGYTIDDIIALLVSKGVGTREDYVDVLENYPFEYRFINELPSPLPEGRVYRLEGYLFPDTYYVFKDASAIEVIDKFLQNTELKLNDARYNRAKELGYTMDEMITLASMVQSEGRYLAEFGTISSVFHNRLDHPAEYPCMQSDATIQYILPTHTVDLTQDDLNVDNRYNTYLYQGLPPGPIANPGLNAIDAALYPEETDYYFFVADAEGNSIFSRTRPEHEAAVARIAAEREQQQ